MSKSLWTSSFADHLPHCASMKGVNVKPHTDQHTLRSPASAIWCPGPWSVWPGDGTPFLPSVLLRFCPAHTRRVALQWCVTSDKTVPMAQHSALSVTGRWSNTYNLCFARKHCHTACPSPIYCFVYNHIFFPSLNTYNDATLTMAQPLSQWHTALTMKHCPNNDTLS